MLYIFHVDTGTTITFDIELALQSVAELQEAIERECGVVAEHQVLLMSGGESLEPNARVCSYSAGTDTNPIYLFSKAAIESHLPPTPSIDYGSDVDLQSQIDSSLAMPATYQTLVQRAQLAQQCCGLAREQTRICEKLVHDQHLQQQGWAAVVANLEDITQMFQSRADLLQQSFALYLAERQQHMELLNNFTADLGTLSKIPILPALRAHAEGLFIPEEANAEPEEESERENEKELNLTLLKWIAAKDNQSSLEQVAEQSSRGLEQFDERVMEMLKSEVNAAIDSANKQHMKEIKGLGERLFSLEELLTQARKLVHEQSELAQGFLQNQNRANNLGDPSVLPDLCTSHRRQLLVMLQNHNQLRDIRRRCTKAKEELSGNIYIRLKWIMYVENKMMEVFSKIIMYHESLKRLRRHLEVLEQIHMAPQMYMNAIAEVVRRRTFSQAFLVWASDLACQLLTVHSEELARRREFQSKFEGHFLNTLFPGLEDTPPPFATQAPSVFDNGLPKLTVNDMESLRSQLPDLSLTISTPDLNSITQFFLSKSLTEASSDSNKEKDSSSMPVDVSTKEKEHIRAPLLSDRAEFESETDTEEFEKIGQAGGVDSKPTSFDGAKQKHQKQLEENLGNTRDEVERLRFVLRTVKTIAFEALRALREELTLLRERTNVDQTGLTEMSDRIKEALALHTREFDRALREREQELTVDHELEMTDIKKLIDSRDEEIRSIKRNLIEKETELEEHERLINTMRQKLETEQAEVNLHSRVQRQLEEALEQMRLDKENAVKEANDARIVEVGNLTNSLNQCHERIRELEDNIVAARAEQQRMVKETADKLQIEYKTELESIRSRFKLMAASTMERSPSDSSLEKIERPDVIEFANHEAILAQTKENMEIEKVAAVSSAVEKERAECVSKLDQELRIAQEMIEEKNREIEILKTRSLDLVEECKRYQATIRRVTESESLVRLTLSEKVENLEADKARLETKMVAERKMLEQKESLVHDLEAERNELRQELNDERLKMSQSNIEENLKVFKDDVEVSESKKVRLESSEIDHSCLTRRLELLENDNKRLNAELRVIRESKEATDAKIEALEADKVRLEVELVKERSRRKYEPLRSTPSETREKDMNASVAVVPDASLSSDASSVNAEASRQVAPAATTSTSSSSSSSVSHVREKLTKSTDILLQQGRVNISSCNTGDIVLVLYDAAHKNYTVLQDSSILHFLNSDCLDSLNLRLSNSDGTPKRAVTVAEVVDKEYCHARKMENRYKVPQGTKFYRVRVKAVQGDTEVSTKSQH